MFGLRALRVMVSPVESRAQEPDLREEIESAARRLATPLG